MSTAKDDPFLGGAIKPAQSTLKPFCGSCSPIGSAKPTVGSVSSLPERAYAVTISGLAKKESVAALPSLRPGKFRL